MDKVKIQEIAEEAGLSNGELIEKAKELGFNVKAANSAISMDDAGILVDFAISGTLPKGFKKPGEKPKLKVVKKKTVEKEPETIVEAPVIEKETAPEKTEVIPEETENTVEESTAAETVESEPETAVIEEIETPAETAKEETVEAAPVVKEVKQRKGISVVSKKAESEAEKGTEIEKPKRRTLSRTGIKIVRKAKPAPVRAATRISMGSGAPTPPSKKKVKKGPAEARETGKKIDIFNHDSMSGDIDSGFGEEEVVLLDFSDKNIYEDMMRQEQKRREEAKKREAANGGPAKGRQPFRPQQRRSLKRGGKRKKYTKEESSEVITSVEIPENVRVYEFAEKVNRSVGEVVKVLFALGMMVTKNDFLSKDEIEILAEEFGVEVSTMNPLDELDYVQAYDEVEDTHLEERPPVITIMGHVDHGKTSLLDKIRSAKVADKEAGGITQHVGAYQVEKNGKKITFVDTPGHEAFTEMRARGAQATDIVIIVVAADDGVMPQTKEAIAHTKAAGVPMIIAMNKMDKESANPDNIKSQLAEIDVMAADWGGEYEFVPVSAHTGLGIDDLLETILLQAEMMELKADPTRKAKAVVVESSVEKGFGPVANVIIKNGTLHVGDNVIVGTTYGRIKAIKLDDGSAVKEIGPSTPAAIVGLNEVPGAGEALVAMDTDKEVRELAEKRAEYDRAKQLSKSTKASLDDLSALIAEGQLKSLPVIIKADVQGSLEAIKGSLEKLRNEEVKVNIIHEGVGGVTESDVTLADASEHAVILGFNVRPTGSVKKKAKELGVEVRTYTIIYDLLDDVKALLGGMMSPVIKEEVTGQAEVRETFVVGKVGTIAGCKVSDGVITRNSKARLIRDGVVVYESKISSLKRFNEDAREVKNGYECGIMLENFNDIKEGDVIETFKDVEEQVTL
ncbi:translation initiation factor IF-2 [Sulfurovum sp. NBC37-1]|uniref:Translation initiation factor IF-2 n=1 Tax=Sulfurovum sp. (strain NBC37-1) TaxID=387093 RepID=IF2_SULNB|nr:translation initiation factor IF-2 [Sulfurovum sp. NBC37-1]A6QBQ5.1 RecName: Full=Translation initiation factor IF-2 [Sulfurovum sp. NBC37-1]BAF72914.1 translation initiation factor IF-2 [Sulfurovum sp. NBC37-1]